jgi:hypothetical protein
MKEVPMKIRIALILLAGLILISTGTVRAQISSVAARNLEDLRAQLSEVEYNEADLKIRLERLDYDLRPENIERHFNGYGTTRPEELRDARRRQLQIEKDHLLARLEQLSSQRVRLTAAITDAQGMVYQQSAKAAAVAQPDPNRSAQVKTTVRILIGTAGLIIVLGSLVLAVAIRRRRQHPDALAPAPNFPRSV